MTTTPYPRNLRGYGETPPDPKWPNNARLALQFVLNYEEGAENCILHGDPASEMFLSEIVGASQYQGQRHMNMESLYEYGSRAGYWRLHRLLTEYDVPTTVFAVAMALERNPAVIVSMQEAGWEIASHGYRWIDYQFVEEAVEREHLERAINVHERLTGERPLGWYLGRCSPNTHRLVAEHGGFVYNADSYADDLPYWDHSYGEPQLMVPYTLDVNDMRFATAQGFNTGRQFYQYLKDSFDELYREGADKPKMMSVGLHCRLAGKPGRTKALRRFLKYIRKHDDVWVARRIDIAQHWRETHPADEPPPVGAVSRAIGPKTLDKAEFIAHYGTIYEHSPWVAEQSSERAKDVTDPARLGEIMAACVDAADDQTKLALIRAHPDLAGRAAIRGELTAESSAEQASAGIDQCSEEEFARFQALNRQYREKFGFPFVMAVRGKHRTEILAAFEQRLGNDRNEELATAIREIHKIARLRLEAMESQRGD